MAMLTYCFAAIGAINLLLEIYHKVRRKVIIQCWREHPTGKKVPDTHFFWSLTNDGRKVISIRQDVLQVKGLRGIYVYDTIRPDPEGTASRGWFSVEEGDHPLTAHPEKLDSYCVREVPSYALLREGGSTDTICWGLREIATLADHVNRKAPLKCRVVFLTSTKRIYRSRWVKIASLEPPPPEG